MKREELSIMSVIPHEDGKKHKDGRIRLSTSCLSANIYHFMIDIYHHQGIYLGNYLVGKGNLICLTSVAGQLRIALKRRLT